MSSATERMLLHPDQGETLVECIERVTLKKLTMKTSLRDHLSQCNPQLHSPLFSILPKEIRDMILMYATAQHEDLSQSYPEDAFYYRPGHRGPHKTSTSILLTCRRLWLEANDLPMRQTVLTFWLGLIPGPPKQLTYDIGRRWTKLNKENFTALHFVMQQGMLSNFGRGNSAEQDMLLRIQPKVLRITIPYTESNLDHGEDSSPPALETTWLQRTLDAPHLSSVQTLQLELETLQTKTSQLSPIIHHLSQLHGRARQTSASASTTPTYHTQLKFAPNAIYTYHWTRRDNVFYTTEPPISKNLEQPSFIVKVLTWHAIPCSANAKGSPITEVTFQTPRVRCRIVGRRPSPTMNDHMLRLQLLQGGWDRLQFPFANSMVRKYDLRHARKTEEDMNRRFLYMFAEVERRKLEEKWKMGGSFLKFED